MKIRIMPLMLVLPLIFLCGCMILPNVSASDNAALPQPYTDELRPDLVPTEIVYDESNVSIGQEIYFDSGILNNGSTDSERFNIKWFVNDEQLGYGGHQGIPAGGLDMTSNSQFYWTPGTAGDYKIEFIVDSDDTVDETDEKNNSAYVNVTITNDSNMPSLTPLCTSTSTQVPEQSNDEYLTSMRNQYKNYLSQLGIDISAGTDHTIGLNADGTVVAVGNNEFGKCDVSDLNDIVAISAGGYHTVGLKGDGKVVAAGYNGYGACNVSDWQDVVAISAGFVHTVGLKADGTVITVGHNGHGQCNTYSWQDISAISAGTRHTVGLKTDGTVVAVGNNEKGQCNVSGWQNIVSISAGDYHTVGLKADGTVVAVGLNEHSECNTNNWQDIIAISAGGAHTVGLKADGTVVAIGYNKDDQCNVSSWQHIVTISAGGSHTVGLYADGEVVAVGNNELGQCEFKTILDSNEGEVPTHLITDGPYLEELHMASFMKADGTPAKYITTVATTGSWYATAILRNTQADTKIRFVWYDSLGYVIDKYTLDPKGATDVYIFGTLKLNSAAPEGEYWVELYIDDATQPAGTIKFSVVDGD